MVGGNVRSLMHPEPAVEIERKFDVAEDTALPPLHQVFGVDRVDQPVEHQLRAEYYDTGDLRLAARRITLRRRTGGKDAGWHLKLPAGPEERHEYHEPLGKKADGIPEALLRLVRVHTRDTALMPVARLKTRRLVHRLRDTDGEVLADFTDDQVQAEAFVPEKAARRWREWEVELVNGSRDLLDAVQGAFAATGVHPAEHASKLARALGTALPAGPGKAVEPTPAGPAGDVLLVYLTEQLAALVHEDPHVRLDKHDAVHRMRVATRRARSVLATYRTLLTDTTAASLLRDELKWLAGVLGQARDAEVMHQRLKDMLADEPSDLVMGPVARRIDLELGSTYRDAHTHVLEALDGERYFRLLDTLESLLAAPRLTPLGHKRAKDVIPELINRDITRLQAAVREARRHPAGIGDHPALHEVRKDGKRLRYAAEAALPIKPKKAAALRDAAHGIQKILGDHQDSIVTRTLLRRLGATAFEQGENGFSYGRLHALEQSAALDAENQFHHEWRNFPTPLLTH
ncbi:CYTH and CHAD domain-containing protein [Arthrobacter sp. MDT2-2]